jgi:hypothetical protein
VLRPSRINSTPEFLKAAGLVCGLRLRTTDVSPGGSPHVDPGALFSARKDFGFLSLNRGCAVEIAAELAGQASALFRPLLGFVCT